MAGKHGVHMDEEDIVKLKFDQEAPLPMGFYFVPSDAQIIGYHLVRKIMGYQRACSVVKEIDGHAHDPFELPIHEFKWSREKKTEAYYYTQLKEKHKQCPSLRITKTGYWKDCNGAVPIFLKYKIVGFMRIFVFYQGQPTEEGIKTNWVIHEYKVNPSCIPLVALEDGSIVAKVENYVVCKIRKFEDKGAKKKKEKKKQQSNWSKIN